MFIYEGWTSYNIFLSAKTYREILENSEIITTLSEVKAEVYHFYSCTNCFSEYLFADNSAFLFHTAWYYVFFLIQSECGKIRIRITPNRYIFYAMSPISITVVFKLAPNWKHESILFFANFFEMKLWKILRCTKKRSFPLHISSVNVAKFAGNCKFGHICWRNPCIAICSFPDRNLHASIKHNLYLAQ